ncbi:hypothetical protein HKD24_03070 [Gluconobacter sp. LMG 31484]|uniref:Uncharacterized protein n=1 Tax=Gluconobacter vitians TaxID=2728102 RepID=A0ABR9Y400_9PROT|nr:hypothetical protein [Gluconobacter vitians]MBF0858194.1 hypothetical protein [Gluconobacter vitians]
MMSCELKELEAARSEMREVRDFLKRADVKEALSGLNSDALFEVTFKAARATVRINNVIEHQLLETA